MKNFPTCHGPSAQRGNARPFIVFALLTGAWLVGQQTQQADLQAMARPADPVHAGAQQPVTAPGRGEVVHWSGAIRVAPSTSAQGGGTSDS